MKELSLTLCVLSALLGGISNACAQEAMQPVEAVQPVWRTDVTSNITQRLELFKLVPGGQAQNIRLTGVNNRQVFDFGVRNDELLSKAVLELNFTASPALIAGRSQINVLLNGQVQRSLAITPEMLGKRFNAQIKLDPKHAQAANQVSLEFIGHDKDICTTPTSESLWLEIDPSSALLLHKQKVKVANDLSRWPLPFIDTAGNASSVIPFVFGSVPGGETKEAAAVMASLVGTYTKWRGADFPVYYNTQPVAGHFFVFATNSNRPDFLKDVPLVDGPEVMMLDAPGSLYAKMLIIAGRDEADLLTAARALASSGRVMIGERFKVTDYKLPEARQAYDAPNWADPNNPIVFSSLMEYPGQLTSRGYEPAPVHLSMRLPPDLYMVRSGGIDVNLKYRFTKPQGADSAQLRMLINNFLAESVNLPTKTAIGEQLWRLPSINGPLATSLLEPSALASLNDLSFQIGYYRELNEGTPDNCKSVVLLPHQIEIDPSSSITLDGVYHFVELPNLALFTQSGYPFSQYADLSETVAVIAEDAPAEKVTTLLNTVGRIASVTGAVATHLTVTGKVDQKLLEDKDVLLISEMPLTLPDFKQPNAEDLYKAVQAIVSGQEASDEGSVLFSPLAGVGAVVSMQSPFDSAKTVVALLSEGHSGSFLLNEKLQDPNALFTASGSVSIVQEGSVLSFDVGSRYTVGFLPWYHRVWQSLSNSPLILALCTLICAVLVGGSIFYFMRLWVKGRAR